MAPIYGVTMGDSSGIGPEILLKASAEGKITLPIVVYGDLEALKFYSQQISCPAPLRTIGSPAEFAPGFLNIIDAGIMNSGDVTVGKISAKSGRAAGKASMSSWLRLRAALAGEIAAMVTLPMNKGCATQALRSSLYWLYWNSIGDICGVPDVTIMLVSDQLVVTHVSTHVSLSTAIARAKKDRIFTIIKLTCEAMSRLREHPRVAVAGLNPHAGENGLFGDEEIREITPAVEWAKSQGMPVEGPFPPDTLFYMAVRKKKFDAIVCMYHDQVTRPPEASRL